MLVCIKVKKEKGASNETKRLKKNKKSNEKKEGKKKMKKSATKLMKELKYIESEITELHKADETGSVVPVNDEYEPRFKTAYDYSKNREAITELQKREREIKMILNRYNSTQKVDGYEFTLAEGLIRLAQLKSEIKVLTNMAAKKQYGADSYSHGFRSEEVVMAAYDIAKVKEDLKVLQNEFSDLQVAIDKTNLNSSIDC